MENDHSDADKIIIWSRLQIMNSVIYAKWAEYLGQKVRILHIVVFGYIVCTETCRLIAEFNTNKDIHPEQFVEYGLAGISLVLLLMSFKKLFFVDITAIFIVLMLSLQLDYTIVDKSNASQIALMTNFNCWICLTCVCLSARFYMAYLIVVPLVFTGLQCFFRWRFIP